MRYLGIEYTLLVAVYFKSSQDVNFLDQKKRSILLTHFLRDLSQQSGSVCILVSLSEQLDSLDLLVLLDQVVGVPLEQLFNLDKVILLSELYCLVPLVEQDAAINSPFNISELDIRTDCCITEAHCLEPVS